MKKLLSLLTISGVIASSSTVVSCGESSKQRVKVDISSMTFTDSTATTGEGLYTDVRTQIGKLANPSIDAAEVKKDTNCQITISDSKQVEVNDDTDAIASGSFEIKMTVLDSDIYFTKLDTKTFSINVNTGRTIADSSTIVITNVKDVLTNSGLYNAIRKQIGGFATPAVNEATIQGDDKCLIAIWDSAGKGVEDDGVLLAPGNFDVKIQILTDDVFFTELSTKNFAISVNERVPTNSENIDISTATAANNQDLYNDIRRQIGDVANPIVAGSVIKADMSCLIAIWNSDGEGVADDTATVTPGTFDVKIQILANDKYFTELDTKTFKVAVTNF